jgi:nicotinamidase-related amidase
MLNRDKAVLVVIDMQGNLAKAMDDRLFLYENNRKMIQGARILGIPVIITEQVNIGNTIPEIAELLDGVTPITKESFSCWKNKEFVQSVKALKRGQVIVTGIECHVCVYQTVADMIAAGYAIHLVADAVSSRTAKNREIGIQKMVALGALPTSAEMALFELLQTAAHEKARTIFKLLK